LGRISLQLGKADLFQGRKAGTMSYHRGPPYPPRKRARGGNNRLFKPI